MDGILDKRRIQPELLACGAFVAGKSKRNGTFEVVVQWPYLRFFGRRTTRDSAKPFDVPEILISSKSNPSSSLARFGTSVQGREALAKRASISAEVPREKLLRLLRRYSGDMGAMHVNWDNWGWRGTKHCGPGVGCSSYINVRGCEVAHTHYDIVQTRW